MRFNLRNSWRRAAMASLMGVLAACGSGDDEAVAIPPPVESPPTVSLFAGSLQRIGVKDGVGTAAQFNAPEGVAQDAAGNVFVADRDNHAIRRIAPDGRVTTLAGTAGQAGSADGSGAAARFSGPRGIALDAAGNVYVADSGNHAVRRVTPAGVVTTLAGSAGQPGIADGAGTTARFNAPSDIAVDAAGNVYVASDSAVRRIAVNGTVTTFAGVAGQPGSVAGDAASARFNGISGLAVDGAGRLWVAESVDGVFGTTAGRLRRFSAAGAALPIGAAPGGVLAIPFASGIATDAAGNVFVASGGVVIFTPSVAFTNSSVSRVSPEGVVTLLAGKDSEVGSVDGPGATARFRRPQGIAVGAGGALFVADNQNASIRRIDAQGVVSTVAGGSGNGFIDGPAASARFFLPTGLAAATDGSFLVADNFNGRIRRVGPGGDVSTVSVTNQDGSAAVFTNPQEVLVNPNGGFFVAEARTRFSDTVWFVDAAGRRRIVEGRGSDAIAMDAAGNLYRAFGSQVTVTTPAGVVKDFATGFNAAEGIAIDRAAGTVYIADLLDANIRVYDLAGTLLRTIGRRGESGYRDGPAADALFAGPSVLTLDPAGNLYIADNSNTIRKLSRDGVVRTIAGIAGASGIEPGGVNAPLGRVAGLVWSGGALYATLENGIIRITPVP